MPPDRPNVLLVVTDQHRADWLGHAGSPVRTPTIDRLAERGVTFSNALCAANPCAPSRACLASGNFFDRSPVAENDDDWPLDRPTLYGRLRDEAGYRVLGAGKFDLLKGTPYWGTDGRYRVGELGFSDAVNNAGNWDAVLSLAGDFGWPPTREDWERAAANADDPNDPYMAYLHDEGLAEAHIGDHRRRMEAGYYGATFPTPLPPGAYCDNWLARNGLGLLADCPVGEPWFLTVNFVGPHAPMNVTGEMHGWYRDPGVEFPGPVATGDHPVGTGVLTPPADYTPEEHDETRRNYAAMIENVDRWLGRYLDAIEERGELADTLVVFTSDHGEMLGDHNKWAKGFPYHPSVRIPMVVAGAGVAARGEADALVSLVDLYATVCACAGVDPGGVDSRSLWPVLSGATDDHRSHLRVGKTSWRAVFDGRHKLIDWRDDIEWVAADTPGEGTPEYSLFDLREDPNETADIAAEEPATARRLARHLDDTEARRDGTGGKGA
ncbi:MAG: sulfatase [Halobacteriaceae archaeon]